jgi:hypothetical protein
MRGDEKEGSGISLINRVGRSQREKEDGDSTEAKESECVRGRLDEQ